MELLIPARSGAGSRYERIGVLGRPALKRAEGPGRAPAPGGGGARRATARDYAIILALLLTPIAAVLHSQRHAIFRTLGLEPRSPPAEAEPWKTLGALFPQDHARITALATPALRSQALDSWLSAHAADIAHAPDAQIVELATIHLRLLRATRAVNPALCAKVATGRPEVADHLGNLPPIGESLRHAYMAAEIRAAAASASSHGQTSLKLTRVDARALDRGLSATGDTHALLVVRHPGGEAADRVCRAGVSLDKAILRLPHAQAARIGRSVLGDVWKLPG